ncbi:MAG: phosphoribosylamine--glycine ligase [Bacteroidetes bacterium]|nr:phosphoribosylamine--glycine ligase [Bacteroidota bacterium]
MKVLVVGSGGREHALVDAILRDKGTQVYCAPGNAGISRQAECVNIKSDDISSLLRFAKSEGIDLTVVGPEQPLAAGIVDVFESRGRKIFGPRKLAARLETSKAFAKEFMKRWKIPTSDFMTFTIKQTDELRRYLEDAKYPLVLKADGLAAGKGVSIVGSRSEAEAELEKFFVKKVFGESGERIVVEEFMTGTEASVFAITDGEDYVVLPPAQDHKRVGDNDLGKNTGGMGAFAPTPFVSPGDMEKVKSQVIERVIEGTRAEGYAFRGCLYCGLMLTEEGPKVVEFNARFGDPETQAVLQLIDSSVLGLLQTAADRKIGSYKLTLNGAAAVCVIAASQGYPDHYEKGKEIIGLDDNLPGTKIFHSGSVIKEGKTLTDGGRVLGITGVDKGGEIKRASELAYSRAQKLHFDGMFFRHDIGNKAINFELKKGPNR